MTSEQQAAAIVAEALGSQSPVAIADGIATLPAWDSLAHLRIVLGIEAALGRALGAEEIAAIDSVRAVAALLARR